MQDAITPLPQYVFMAWCLVKHRDNFSVYFWMFLTAVYYTVRMIFILSVCFLYRTQRFGNWSFPPSCLSESGVYEQMSPLERADIINGHRV